MLYWFYLNLLSLAKSIEVKYPSIDTWELAQLDRYGNVNITAIGSTVQSLLDVD